MKKWEMKVISKNGAVINKDDYLYHMVELNDDSFSFYYNYTGNGASQFLTPRDLNITFNLNKVSRIWNHTVHSGLNSTTTMFSMEKVKSTKVWNICRNIT
jgi:hypothetical protein